MKFYNTVKKILCLCTLTLLISMLCCKVYAEDREKGDINGDGKITITDVSALKVHLVGIREIATEHQTYADINADGKVTVTDLSQLKGKIVGLNNSGEELDINSELVQELYGYVPDSSGIPNMLDAYRSKKVTVEDIDNQLILRTAFFNKKIEIGENAFVDEGNAGNLQDSQEDNSTWLYFTIDVMEEAVKRVFGNNIGMKHEDFDVTNGVSSCTMTEYNGFDMYHYTFGGSGGDWHGGNKMIINAFKENDEIYLYDRYVFYILADDVTVDEDGSLYVSSSQTLRIYPTSEKSNLLRELKSDKHFAYNELYDKMADLMKTYKHTFKKADNGSYYWYSTEPVE